MAANINDASAIQALLDQLKSSDAWQRVANPDAGANVSSDAHARTVQSDTAVDPEAGHTVNAFGDAYQNVQVDNHPPADFASTSEAAPSVASLLSQLQSSSAFSAVSGPNRPPAPTGVSPAHSPPPPIRSQIAGPDAQTSSISDTPPRPPHTPPGNLRACTFQQALPHLARLSGDPEFLRTLTAMKAEQTDLERQLWRERREIQRKHEERVKAARTKASIIGAGLTQYEADAMTDSFRAELQKFDRERVLAAWDGLVTKQQAALEALGVPAMFPTAQATDLERQQKIMHVLGGIVGSEGSHPTRTPITGGDG